MKDIKTLNEMIEFLDEHSGASLSHEDVAKVKTVWELAEKAMQAAHAKAIEAAYREGFLDSKVNAIRFMEMDEDINWTDSHAYASLHKGDKA